MIISLYLQDNFIRMFYIKEDNIDLTLENHKLLVREISVLCCKVYVRHNSYILVNCIAAVAFIHMYFFGGIMVFHLMICSQIYVLMEKPAHSLLIDLSMFFPKVSTIVTVVLIIKNLN